MKKFLLLLTLLSSFQSAVFANSPKAQVEIWNSVEGLKKLERSQFKNDFYQLANFYQPQINPLYCAVATGTMIVNALNYGNIESQKVSEVKSPKSDRIIPFPSHSQLSFLNEKTDKVKKREVIEYKEPTIIDGKENYDAGVSLSDFARILQKAYKLRVRLIYANKLDEKSIDQFRQFVKESTADKKSFIALNFNGKILGLKTGGHISPIAAYDEESDSILVLDVALHKNMWYWVDVESIYEAMNTKDGNTYRGYLIIKK